jgi:hypothetical protein
MVKHKDICISVSEDHLALLDRFATLFGCSRSALLMRSFREFVAFQISASQAKELELSQEAEAEEKIRKKVTKRGR